MLKSNLFRTVISIACLMTMSGVASADTKVKSRQTSGGQTYENTSYIKGKRQRTETNNGQMIMLQQCDLRRNIQIMPQAKVYLVQPYDEPASGNAANASSSSSQPGSTKKGGVVTSTVNTRDTGERKQIFGYTARRLITTMVTDSSPDACSQTKIKMEIDGWYIDAAFALDCDISQAYKSYTPQTASGCQDRYETKQTGIAKKGFPVWEKTTMFNPGGDESFSTINEVVEFSHATLDASLFDVPEGYREVKDFASAFGTPATTGNTESEPAPSPSSNATTHVPAAPATPEKKQESPVKKGLKSLKPKW